MRATTEHRHNKVKEAYEKWSSKRSLAGAKIYSEEHIISIIAEDRGYSIRYTEDIIFERTKK